MPERNIPELWTVDEAAENCHCCVRLIREAVARGDITAFKPGKMVMLDKKSAVDWFFSRKVKARARVGRPRKAEMRQDKWK